MGAISANPVHQDVNQECNMAAKKEVKKGKTTVKKSAKELLKKAVGKKKATKKSIIKDLKKREIYERYGVEALDLGVIDGTPMYGVVLGSESHLVLEYDEEDFAVDVARLLFEHMKKTVNEKVERKLKQAQED